MHHEKLETLQPIISNVGCLCENSILYKYQITLIVFFIHVCFQIEYCRTLGNLDKNKLAYQVHTLSLRSVMMNLNGIPQMIKKTCTDSLPLKKTLCYENNG